MSKDDQIALRDDAAVSAPVSEAGTMARLLEAAIDKNVPVEALEKLVMLNERIAVRNAAMEFNAALADFQRHCPPVGKNKTATITTDGGGKFSYKYAELDEIVRAIGEALHSRGLSFSWDSVLDEKGRITCTCTLRHVNGHTSSASFAAPPDSRANKAMSDSQKVASVLQFARRQSLISVLGLTTADPDTDAAMPRNMGERITNSQVADLAALVDEVKANKDALLKWIGVASLSDIPAARYKEVVAQLNRKRGKA